MEDAVQKEENPQLVLEAILQSKSIRKENYIQNSIKSFLKKSQITQNGKNLGGAQRKQF